MVMQLEVLALNNDSVPVFLCLVLAFSSKESRFSYFEAEGSAVLEMDITSSPVQVVEDDSTEVG